MSSSIDNKKEIDAVIDDAVEFLELSLNGVYCDTCKYNDSEDDSDCDYCNRKQMGWSISNNTAWSLVYTIVKQLKRNMKFEESIHSMFDHIWGCEIDHPIFQDTVGDLMTAVIQAYNNIFDD